VKIVRPTLLLDEEKCKKNIQRMAEKARKNNLIFRPHFKTHQSSLIGEWFREKGLTRITVSSVAMAEYFARAGWKDILIAFPVNVLEIDQINTLAQNINLSLLIESEETSHFLKNNLTSKVSVSLKIDTGYHRTGIAWDNTVEIKALVELIRGSSNLNFTGFVAHSGHTYRACSSGEIVQIYNDSLKKLSHLKEEFSKGEIIPIISTGDTPSCSIVEDFKGIDEIRPGNFAFYDVMQYRLGVCDLNDIAVVLACPVVAKHLQRNEVIIYGGAIHLSKESIIDSNGICLFGLVVKLSEYGWTEPLPGTYVKALSQEHGIIHTTHEILSKIHVGDIVGILPVHSCLTAHQMRTYLTTEGRQISTLNS
jgi:D-serine deaminase-like pyridoxal phosphate-dependent protein